MNRRTLIGGGIAGLGVAGGVALGPFVAGGRPTLAAARPESHGRPPTLAKDAVATARRDHLSLAALARACGHQGWAGRAGQPLRRLSDWHRHRAAVLAASAPLTRLPGSLPALPSATAPGDAAAGWAALTKAGDALAKAESDAAADATGLARLFWAGTAAGVRAGGIAAARGVAPFAGGLDAALTTGPVADATTARRLVLTDLHAAVYVLQAALGRLTGEDRRTVTTRLAGLRVARDLLTDTLQHVGVTVAPAAAYALPGPLRTPDDARSLVTRTEIALLPRVGQWVGIAEPATARTAVSALADGAATAATCGGSVPVWVGWPA